MPEFLTSLRLEKSPLCIYSTFCLSIQSSTGTKIFSRVRLFPDIINNAMNTVLQITESLLSVFWNTKEFVRITYDKLQASVFDKTSLAFGIHIFGS